MSIGKGTQNGRSPSLKSLVFIDRRITDDVLRHLKSLRHRETLCLSDNGITDEGLQHLAKLMNLKWLDISWTNVSDAGMQTAGSAASGVPLGKTIPRAKLNMGFRNIVLSCFMFGNSTASLIGQ